MVKLVDGAFVINRATLLSLFLKVRKLVNEVPFLKTIQYPKPTKSLFVSYFLFLIQLFVFSYFVPNLPILSYILLSIQL